MGNRKEFIKQLGILQKSMHVKKNQSGYNFSFRNAEQILKVAKENLPEGFAIIIKSKVEQKFNKVFYFSTAIFTDGENKEVCTSCVPIPAKMASMSEPQVYGACSSYSKKYALCNLLAVDDSEEDPDRLKPENSIPKPNDNPNKPHKQDTKKASVNNSRDSTGEADPKIKEAWDIIKETMEKNSILQGEIRFVRDGKFNKKSFSEFSAEELLSLNKEIIIYAESRVTNDGVVNETPEKTMSQRVNELLNMFAGQSVEIKEAFFSYFQMDSKIPLEQWPEDKLLQACTELEKCNKDPRVAATSPIFKKRG